jgi:transcriptional regulator with XRE-family HTH domain
LANVPEITLKKTIMDMKDRIRQLMESQKMSQQTFADAIGLSPATLSNIFNGRTKPTLNHVDAIMSCFPNLNLGWLLYGQGDMYVPSDGNDVDGNISASDDDMGENAGGVSFSDGGANMIAGQGDLWNGAPTPQGGNMAKNQGRKIVAPEVKYSDKPQRQITEIRIFFDDQTWETFVPKK